MAKNNFWKQLIGNLFGDSNIFNKFSNWITNHAESWINSQTGAELTGAEREANAFTAEQAAISRQWQENMRATNFQAQVQDMKQAGLNPALMYANGGSSSTPSGASGTSVAPNSPSSLSEILQAFKVKQEIAKLKAETSNIESQTEINKVTVPKIQADTDLVNLQKKYYPDLTEAQIDEVNAHAQELVELANQHRSQVSLNYAKAFEANASRDFLRAQEIIKKKESEWYDTLRQAEVDLKAAQTEQASWEGFRAKMQALVEGFRNDYMRTFGTEVPDGALVGFTSMLANTLGNTIFSKDAWIELLPILGQTVPSNTTNVNVYPDNKNGRGHYDNTIYLNNTD